MESNYIYIYMNILQLLLGMDLLPKTSHLGTPLAQQTTRPLHCVLDPIYQYFTDVALKVTKTHCMCTPRDNSTGSVTSMAQLTSSLAMPLWFSKTATSLQETLQTKWTLSLPKEEPIQTRTLAFPFTILELRLPRIWIQFKARLRLILEGLGNNIHEQFSWKLLLIVLSIQLVGWNGVETLHWVLFTMESTWTQDQVLQQQTELNGLDIMLLLVLLKPQNSLLQISSLGTHGYLPHVCLSPLVYKFYHLFVDCLVSNFFYFCYWMMSYRI